MTNKKGESSRCEPVLCHVSDNSFKCASGIFLLLEMEWELQEELQTDQ